MSCLPNIICCSYIQYCMETIPDCWPDFGDSNFLRWNYFKVIWAIFLDVWVDFWRILVGFGEEFGEFFWGYWAGFRVDLSKIYFFQIVFSPYSTVYTYISTACKTTGATTTGLWAAMECAAETTIVVQQQMPARMAMSERRNVLGKLWTCWVVCKAPLWCQAPCEALRAPGGPKKG